MPATEYLNLNRTRLAALYDFKLLDSGAETVYDEITELTAELCETPICLISLVDEDRQWFKSEIGLCLSETKIEQSICAHAVGQDDYLEIHDTWVDPRTVQNTLCQGERPIRFYAGAILRSFEGWPLGTLCVLDYTPRTLTDLQRRVLRVHAASVMRQLEFTRVLINKSSSAAPAPDDLPQTDTEKQQHKIIRERFDALTKREQQVVELIAGHPASLTSKEIAKELGISFRTVHNHRANLMKKMRVDSVAELISVVLRAGIYR